jgi:DNA mismatch repair protein MutL
MQNISTTHFSETQPLQPKPIHLLPSHLINRIAAGEVIERPASVVKELVENALDAGATQISIIVGSGGRNLRIADNGHGMHADNALKAFYNHATSKISSVEELERIQTLGFRGEALASIASISRMHCLTRLASASQGVKVQINELGEPNLSEAGCAPGTVMSVDDLFYNTPARLKFLKRPQTELGHIEEAVQYLALSHPEVRFRLELGERQVLATSGSASLRKTLEELFPLTREQVKLIPVLQDETETAKEGALSLAGFVSEPGFMKSGKRWLMTFVNGRHVRCGILQKAVEAAYESLLPTGKYPLAALFLSLPYEDVDVNVHPSKREVRYLDSGRVFGFVKSALHNSMVAHGIHFAPNTPFPANPWVMPQSNSEAAVSPSGFSTQTGDSLYSNSPLSEKMPYTGGIGVQPVQQSTHFSSEASPSWPQLQTNLSFSPEQKENSSDLSQQEEIGSFFANFNAPPSTQNPDKGTATTRFKVIGQLFNTYILMETVQGLLVVDQHIASERTFFEALTLNLTSGEPLIQQCLTAPPLILSAVQQDLLQRGQEAFAKLGFHYRLTSSDTDPTTNSEVYLTGFPLIYAGRDGLDEPMRLFEQMLNQLEETGEMNLDLDHLIATLACHSAVRAGDPLSRPGDMETVISRWLSCELPWTCPHGRPIAHTISKADLNRFFHRSSLPVGT